jgi:myo-inositol-1(or 4)-monophosphatase
MGAGQYARELEVARRAADHASQLIAEHSTRARESWDKAEDHPVTKTDLEANERILQAIRTAFPNDAIRSEESGATAAQPGERVWLIDPLDGTKEFIAGIPEFAVSVALTVAGEPVVGVVQQPLTGECFWGALGSGAWLGEERICVTTRATLAQSSVLTSRTETSRGQLDPYKNDFAALRPLGSAALKLAWVAAGRADLWLSLAPKNEWDVCAGDLLVREAGGIFVRLETGPRRYNLADSLMTPPLAAGSADLVAALRERCAS